MHTHKHANTHSKMPCDCDAGALPEEAEKGLGTWCPTTDHRGKMGVSLLSQPLAHHHGSELATILLLPYLLQPIEHRDEEAHIREPLVVQVSDPLH